MNQMELLIKICYTTLGSSRGLSNYGYMVPSLLDGRDEGDRRFLDGIFGHPGVAESVTHDATGPKPTVPVLTRST